MNLWIKDFRLVGFLLSRGLRFEDMRIDPKGDVEFSFEQTKETLITVSDYPNSPEFRYDSSCRIVHDLIKSKLRSR